MKPFLWLMFFSISLQAQNTTLLNGTTVGAPTAFFPLGGGGACTLSATAEPYKRFAVTTNTAGTHTINITDPISVVPMTDDTLVMVYTPSFDAMAGCTNFQSPIMNDPSGTSLSKTLAAGTHYFVVVGFFGSEDAFSLTVTGPPGAVLSSVALAVSLTNFSATIKDNQTKISWQTQTETNSDRFEIQKWQNDGYKTVATVAGSGNSTEPKSYEYQIENSGFGYQRYRLKMVDKDGSFKFSEEINILNELPESAHLSTVYPNPFQENGRIELVVAESGNATVEILNILGQKVTTIFNEQLNANEAKSIVIHRNGLASGTYFIHAKGDNFNKMQSFVLN